MAHLSVSSSPDLGGVLGRFGMSEPSTLGQVDRLVSRFERLLSANPQDTLLRQVVRMLGERTVELTEIELAAALRCH